MHAYFVVVVVEKIPSIEITEAPPESPASKLRGKWLLVFIFFCWKRRVASKEQTSLVQCWECSLAGSASERLWGGGRGICMSMCVQVHVCARMSVLAYLFLREYNILVG